MNCQEAQPFISALYDGEQISPGVADHIGCCPHCREVLMTYSNMGAELRLLASREPTEMVFPSALRKKLVPRRFSWLSFGRGRMLVPKLAVTGAAGIVLALTGSLVLLHAQQDRRLWFQFGLDPNSSISEGSFPLSQAAQAGFNDVEILGRGPNDLVGTHIVVSEVRDDKVLLAIRARRYTATNTDEVHAKKDLEDLNGHAFTYIPGNPLKVPIEGGGTLTLQGHILDHQPRFMVFGIPVEPEAGQLILSNPVLITGETVLANLKGANSMSNGADDQAVLYAPGTGLFRFALRPFPGATKGRASWGHLDFKLDGRDYSLLTASQISGGDQPHAIWVTNDAQFVPPEKMRNRAFLSQDKLNAPHW